MTFSDLLLPAAILLSITAVAVGIQSTPSSQTPTFQATAGTGVEDLRVAVARIEGRLAVHDTLFDEREKQLNIAFAASDKAIQKAEEAQLRVNVTQNEFRGTLKDQAALLATKDDFEGLDKRVQNLEQGVGRSEGTQDTWGNVRDILPLIFSALGMLGVALLYVTRQQRRERESHARPS